MSWLLIEGINPEPWQAKKLGVIRKGTRWVPTATTPEHQRVYQAALREDITLAYPNLPMFPRGLDLELKMYFWRRLDSYAGPSGRMTRRKEADATNLQKSTEDALQSVLLDNDRQVRRVSSDVIAQGSDVEPMILIGCGNYSAHLRLDDLLATIRQQITPPEIPGTVRFLSDNDHYNKIRGAE